MIWLSAVVNLSPCSLSVEKLIKQNATARFVEANVQSTASSAADQGSIKRMEMHWKGGHVRAVKDLDWLAVFVTQHEVSLLSKGNYEICNLFMTHFI